MTNADRPVEHRGWRFSFAFFAGPILWGFQILAGYGLVTVSCSIANKWPLYLLIGVSAIIVLAAAIVAYGAWRVVPNSDNSIFVDANQARETSTFLAVASVFVSSLFFLVILSTLVADIFLSPCPIITLPLP